MPDSHGQGHDHTHDHDHGPAQGPLADASVRRAREVLAAVGKARSGAGTP